MDITRQEDNIQDLDDLRRQWRELSLRADKLEAKNSELTRKLTAQRASSVKDRIVRRLRCQGSLGFLLPPLGFLIYQTGQVSAFFAIAYALLGVLSALTWLYLANRLNNTDFISLPSVEALRSAVEMRKLLQRGRIVSWTVCGIIILWFLIELWQPSDYAGLIGGCAGLAIGLPIGITKELTNARLTRQMIAELENTD